jgi:uncharacterized protein (DUF2141 family)
MTVACGVGVLGNAYLLANIGLSALLCSAGPAAATELKLRLDGLKPKGQVLVLLFDAEQAWKAKEGAVREIKRR